LLDFEDGISHNGGNYRIPEGASTTRNPLLAQADQLAPSINRTQSLRAFLKNSLLVIVCTFIALRYEKPPLTGDPRRDCKNINILVTPCKAEGFGESHSKKLSQANLLMRQTGYNGGKA